MTLRETIKQFIPPIALDAARSLRGYRHKGRKAPDFSYLGEPFRTIKSKVPSQEFNIIFDIGANLGQSSLAYRQTLPGTTIHAFEPFPDTFNRLKDAVEREKNIFAHNLALSDSSGTLTMSAVCDARMYRIADVGARNGVLIKSTTVEEFCSKHEIDHVDFMKIDTEGHDLAVLQGCGVHIKNVDFIQCEASANRYNRFHNYFIDIFNYMSDRGFYLFDIQGIAYEWTGGGYPVMRRFDPIFINGHIVGKMRGVTSFWS